MAIVEGTYGLEWSHVFLYDAGVQEDTSDFNPTAGPVYATSSTIIVRGVPESEGDIVLRITFDEQLDLGVSQQLLSSGAFTAESGKIVVRTSSWDDMLRIDVAPHSYSFTVHADDSEWPRVLLIAFVSRGSVDPA